MSNTIPPDTRVVGNANPPTDMNNVANILSMLTGQTAGNTFTNIYTVPSWFNVVYYGADPTGTNDSTTAIQNAITACIAAGGGKVYLPAGTYKVSSTITANFNGTAVYIEGEGRWATTIKYYGSGDCLRLYDGSTYGSRTVYGGGVTGLTIDGSNSSGSVASVGLHMGDTLQTVIDITVQSFATTGSKGCWFDNNYYWSEQWKIDVRAGGCYQHVVFDNSANLTSTNATGSFDRCRISIYVNQENGFWDGVVFQNGAFLQDGALEIRGNFAAQVTSPNNAAVLRITGNNLATSNDGSYSAVLNSRVEICVECGANPYPPYTVYFGGSSNSLSGCWGGMDFVSSGFQSSNCTGNMAGNSIIVQGDSALPSGLLQAVSNIASSAQTINTTSATPITTMGLPVGAYATYRIRAYVPYSSTATAGTPTFGFTYPGGVAIGQINYYYQTASSPYSTAPAFLVNSFTLPAGPTLSTGTNLALFIEGTFVLSGSGTLQMTALTSNISDTFTIGIGAYMEIVQVYQYVT